MKRPRCWLCLVACLTMIGAWVISMAQDPAETLTLPCRVLQADGDPLANARLSVSLLIERPGRYTWTTATVTTDEDGRFEMMSEAPGTWRLAIHAGAAGWATAPPADVKPGIDPEPLTAQLQPGGDVFGWVRVKGEDGPIAGASVTCELFGTGSGRVRSGSTTDGDGTFIFPGVPPGEVVILASADGFVPGRATVQVAPDGEITEIVVELSRALTLQGTVVGPDGATPLVDATVRCSGGLEGKTDGRGRFALIPVLPGHVWITALAEGQAPATGTVEVAEGVEPDDVRIVVEHVGGTVLGQVTDGDAGVPAPYQLVLIVPGGGLKDGPPLEDIHAVEVERQLGRDVWSSYHGSEWSYATRTDAEGRYRVEHLPPGTCEVWMVHAVLPMAGPREVEVRDGESVEVDFETQVRPPGYITGRISDAYITGRIFDRGAPIALPGARYRLSRAGRASFTTSTGPLTVGEDGRYYIPAQPGTHQLTIEAAGYLPMTAGVEVDLTGRAPDVDFIPGRDVGSIIRPAEEK